MGKLLVFLVFGALVGFGTFSVSVNEKMDQAVDNAVVYFERTTAKNITRTAVELAMRQLHDNLKWRAGFTDLPVDGGKVSLTVRDSVYAGDSTVVLTCTSIFGQDTAETIVTVKPTVPSVPDVVRGALTAFGRADKIISDMTIDGRNHDANNNVVPGSGTYGVSTGEPTFTNIEPANIGGTSYSGGVPLDLSPTYPQNPLSVETGASWPDGWPTTPDAALNLPEGTLKAIALSGVGGSRYVTSNAQLNLAPIKGVTYIEVPPGTQWTAQWINQPNPEGIFVFHSSATDAFWYRIKVNPAPGTAFKGIMIFDRVFHFHMDLLGALIHLSPNTVTSEDCHQNDDHWMNYSRETISKATSFINQQWTANGWRDKLQIVSWWE